MKIIIGVYDREVSHNLAIILSSKKIIPIEAESMEEIPSLLELNPEAMLLCEETDPAFYQGFYRKNLDVFLLFHPNLNTVELLKLRRLGIRSLIPYTEDANIIIESIAKQLSQLANKLKKDDKSLITPNKKSDTKVTIRALNSRVWTEGTLLGVNSSKVSIFMNKNAPIDFNSDILMYLQGLNIRVIADLVHVDKDNFVFRYRKMTKDDALRLAYFINYCQKHAETEKIVVNI